MSQEFSFSDIDVDGALAEARHDAVEALDGDSRRSFLKRAGLAGGAAMGGGAVLSALVPGAALAFGGGRPPASKFGAGDVGILRFALTLEYLESSFYNEATIAERRRPFLHGPHAGQLRTFLRAVTDDENQHVAALRHVLGSKAQARPKFHFNGDTADMRRFMKASFTFENTGVHAYSGQAFNISEKAVLAKALSIVTVEARHAAVIGLIRNGSVFGISPNNAFDTPFTAAQVLAGVHSLNYGL
ncbi:MAG: ferritin-like domain-containing protein [Solirubrobacteraceae bacterium]